MLITNKKVCIANYLFIYIFTMLCLLFTLRGSCDIDDLILNLTGSIAGYAVYHIVKFVCGENGTKMLRR